MDKKHLIILEIALIILLLFSSSIIEYRIIVFERDCKINYDLNDSCPCKQTKFNENLTNSFNQGLLK
jgi:hypothetical protein